MLAESHSKPLKTLVQLKVVSILVAGIPDYGSLEVRSSDLAIHPLNARPD